MYSVFNNFYFQQSREAEGTCSESGIRVQGKVKTPQTGKQRGETWEGDIELSTANNNRQWIFAIPPLTGLKAYSIK